ncbi:hypothetical protein ACSHT0_17165 [Tepidicaulis sp. LMO-SS28]|uniref:hypothetical protein n=1 Tax=Tepidicaulis sp. LMO-SS28 TaxID=3447455 RepID=UPI003EDEBA23
MCAEEPATRIGFKGISENALVFQESSDAFKSILPMFGAHPLSNVFNEAPPLIVEGEDDERVWQAAVRRSGGRISVHPCVAGDVQSMNEFEVLANKLISSVYENAKAFSFRDRDDETYAIDDIGKVVRSRLNCRAAENLIVTDDVLDALSTDWQTLQALLDKWISDNTSHTRYADMVEFKNSGWDRRNFDLKPLRMVIVGIAGSNKPWEVAVGQSIARLHEGRFEGDHSLQDYLGPKIMRALKLS